jgi:hypothetical protein
MTLGPTALQSRQITWDFVSLPESAYVGSPYWHLRFLPAGIPDTSELDTVDFETNVGVSSPGFIIIKMGSPTPTPPAALVSAAETILGASSSTSVSADSSISVSVTTVTTTQSITSDSTGTSTPDSQSSFPSSNAGLSTGAKAGIAIGVILGVIALLALCYIFWRRRRSQSSSIGSSNPSPTAHELGSASQPRVPGLTVNHASVLPTTVETRDIHRNNGQELHATPHRGVELEHRARAELPTSTAPAALDMAELDGDPSVLRQPFSPVAEMGENSQLGGRTKREELPSYQDVWVRAD